MKDLRDSSGRISAASPAEDREGGLEERREQASNRGRGKKRGFPARSQLRPGCDHDILKSPWPIRGRDLCLGADQSSGAG